MTKVFAAINDHYAYVEDHEEVRFLAELINKMKIMIMYGSIGHIIKL